MPMEDFITWVYCWVADQLEIELQGQRLRQRGFAPGLNGCGSDRDGDCGRISEYRYG